MPAKRFFYGFNEYVFVHFKGACEENCKIFSRKPSKKLESQNNSKKDTSKNLVEKKAFYFKADITIKPPNLLMPENRYKLLLCTHLMSNISY